MASDKPNYLKAAFFNVYNLGLVGGALTASLLSGEYVLGVVALGAEALWLLFGPDLKPFQRAVQRGLREQREAAERERLRKQMESLPQLDWQRATRLDEVRQEIERDITHNPSFKAMLLQSELDKLSQLQASFISLAHACARAEAYLTEQEPRELERQIHAQRELERNLKDATAQALARKNLEVLAMREKTIQEIQNFLARARGQMSLIENSVRLLRDQVLTMVSPQQLGEQLDDLLSGVDAIQATAQAHAELLEVDFAPVAPVSEEAEEARAPAGQKLRG